MRFKKGDVLKMKRKTMSKITFIAAITAVLFLTFFMSVQIVTASETISKGHTSIAARQLTVTYNPNGGMGVVNTVSVNPNTDFTIRDQGYHRRDSYTFAGWNVRPDGLGVHYNNNQVIRVTESIILYATWLSNN